MNSDRVLNPEIAQVAHQFMTVPEKRAGEKAFFLKLPAEPRYGSVRKETEA